MKRKILVTGGLPYANGSIHLGHLVEYIQADIWTRFQKMRGNDCLYLCGSDCHGTPIMLRAEKEGMTPEELVTRIHREQAIDFEDFLIEFDNYYLTHSEENKELSEMIYQRLRAKGDIKEKTIEQAFDPEKNIFLPDRYVKGTCPRCGAKDQYGDSCEACGATYSTDELIDPVSVLSGVTPIKKKSKHFFFQLTRYSDALKKWIRSEHLQEEVANKMDEWFAQGLQDWDITRDAPYFGFEIPGVPGKYFYVWLDAPIGYLASLKNLCHQRSDLDFDDYWAKGSDAELFHFIGKDIVYFHTLFWPAILMSANLRTPTAVYVHGFLTVNGQKMSKSRGTFINARTYLNHLQPEYLRYYFASKLTPRTEDIDLNFEDFRLKINSDLVGKVVNIASRCAGFINKKFDNELAAVLEDRSLLEEFAKAGDSIADYYEHREFSQAIRSIMELADKANQYIAQEKPWVLIKEEGQENQVHQICSLGINLFRILMIYLKPVLPELASKVEAFLKVPALGWEDRYQVLLSHTIDVFQPLMTRVEESSIQAIIEDSKQ
ncbi:MAG: methionine--tRNA ligase [Gammaproteobacteria bacterium]|nr:methionine--tRNA ligase [Gammaproteobacteria bacterium]MBU1629015.1 methionine--tRNA ligase [Gammaproteobacteria bacterium]MBU1926257.1 methionine--tRNA ligase [Gammaproteobacteria bacterium]